VGRGRDSEPGGLPATGPFESGSLPIDVIIVWLREGGWDPSTVLSRIGTSEVVAHTLWAEPFLSGAPGSWEGAWAYLADRIREGRGGNAQSYELDAFAVAAIGDIAPVVTARAAEIAAATHGPLGEPAGTLILGETESQQSIAMPFLLLPKGPGYALVATGHLDDPGCVEVYLQGGSATDVHAYADLEHPQHAGSACWSGQPGLPYVVS